MPKDENGVEIPVVEVAPPVVEDLPVEEGSVSDSTEAPADPAVAEEPPAAEIVAVEDADAGRPFVPGTFFVKKANEELPAIVNTAAEHAELCNRFGANAVRRVS